jgi:pimeloyl-ACP methyl ester carboxylesterase
MSSLAWLLILWVVLLAAGFAYQTYAAARDKRRLSPPGQLVCAGGLHLHLHLMGQEHPGPTIILDAGMVSFSSNWAWVQPEVAKFAPVLAYDRAGLGWSDPAPKPRDAATSARELHTALQKAAIEGPYILAGHSYGGLHVRAFAALYPDEVQGLVLVDSSHPDQWSRMGVSSGTAAIGNRVAALLALFGLFRLLPQQAEMLAKGLPQQQYQEMKAFCLHPSALSAGADALSVWDSHSRPLVNQVGSLGHLPLVVISVTDQPRMGEKLTELQAELPGLSSSSQHITVQGATHEGLLSQQVHARYVVAAIRAVVESLRNKRPLAAIEAS